MKVQTMVIHSGSILLLLAYAVTLVAAIGLLVSIALLFSRKLALALKVLAVSLGSLAVYIASATAISHLAPQKVIAAGNSYCWDLWCMGIERVDSTPRGSDRLYELDVRIFSDANSVKTSTDGAAVYLLDERGRRFPLVQNPGVIPIDTVLNPGESIRTTLTFLAPADTKGPLFLAGEAPLPEHIPLSWRVFTVYMDLHFGYEQLLHKPTMLRVL